MRKWVLRWHAHSIPARCPRSACCAFEGCSSGGVDQAPLAEGTIPGWKGGIAPEQSPGHSGKLAMWHPGWLPLFTEQLLAEPRSQHIRFPTVPSSGRCLPETRPGPSAGSTDKPLLRPRTEQKIVRMRHTDLHVLEERWIHHLWQEKWSGRAECLRKSRKSKPVSISR